MSQSLGEKLREAREERGLSIGEVAEQTRISPLYLESIERDDYKPLPGGIFNKGFVKSYAKFVGLDENDAVQEYSRIVAKTEGLEDKELRVYKSEVLTDDNVAGSMVPTLIFAGIVLRWSRAAFFSWSIICKPAFDPGSERERQCECQPGGRDTDTDAGPEL